MAESIGAAEIEYFPVQDPLIRQKLEEWRDLKFGLLLHWGPYCQWGVVESWSICGEDWIERPEGRPRDLERYREAYRGLKKTFNPVRFDPAKWARAAKEAGMGYVVLTAKHHDGFCMFDSRLTDYKITAPDCPFHADPRADVLQAVFGAFRREGLRAGVYFSKPDWSSPFYWRPDRPAPDRHVNYDPACDPERWERFKEFTRGQIEELTTRYGPVDILWLDGAWVRPLANMPEAFARWAKKKNYDQDIDMARIAAMARRRQPGLIVVDRWVAGEFENYLTPEGEIPGKALSPPWESCIPMAASWSFVPGDDYKPAGELVRMLVDVVSKGGNLLLNIGPSPEGEWAPEACDRLERIGAWMKVNGEALLGTRAMSPFGEGRLRFTRGKDGALYVLHLAEEEEENPPSRIRVDSISPAEGARVTFLGAGEEPAWKRAGRGFEVEVPPAFREDPPCRYAWAVRVSAVRRRT